MDVNPYESPEEIAATAKPPNSVQELRVPLVLLSIAMVLQALCIQLPPEIRWDGSFDGFLIAWLVCTGFGPAWAIVTLYSVSWIFTITSLARINVLKVVPLFIVLLLMPVVVFYAMRVWYFGWSYFP